MIPPGNFKRGLPAMFFSLLVYVSGDRVEPSVPTTPSGERMANWIGRQREANEVYSTLANLAGGGGVLISGVGGSGKTTLARQISERFAVNAKKPATWIDARSPDAFAVFAGELTDAAQGHLVIVDGLDETPDHGRHLALQMRRGLQEREYLHVLATARLNPGLNDFRQFELGPMADDDLQNLLKNLSGSSDIPPQELLQLLDGHPLAATLIGNMVRERGTDYRSILPLFRNYRRPGLLDAAGRPISPSDMHRGRLVTDVRDANSRLLADIKARPELVYAITPRQFEEVSAEIFLRLGYSVELTPRSKDGGVDIFSRPKDGRGLIPLLCGM